MKAPTGLLTGMLLTMSAGAIFAGSDAFVKHLTSLMPVLHVIWGRYFFQTLIMSGWLAASSGTAFLTTRHPVLQLLRGLMLLASTCSMYLALTYVPLADATAVMFASPVIVSVLSIIFLRERIELHRTAAVAAGFAGMLLILDPTFASVDPALLLAFVAAICNAGYLLMTRALAAKEEAASTQFNTTAAGALVLSVVVLPLWGLPDLASLTMLALLGIAGTVAHFALVRAFSYAPASLLSPFLYSQVLIASILSVSIFGDPLRPLMVLGTLVLIGSGLYIWSRQNR